ncbi:filamentous hemagglutinin N-terminal domain-containing protein [Acinetobacter sp. WCHAc060033]|uniref:YDG domain-containing protein n=2 Tax=Acinetobacter TaxID=469 RepID=UPI001023C1FB|nr:YDG domain-containing protein [Acinetobacter sp. WCHAc060033]RZG85995.1 filamentous hemagglutinin N-terminal domain-containing protein [Acinetobacter sp. WCHAc060033]
MNKIYKVIWNAQLGCWQAVSELAKNHTASQSSDISKSTGRSLAQKVSRLILFGMALLPLSIHAAISNVELPTGAHINSGSASFSQNNNTLNINQNTQNLSTNWNTFNIGKDATVNFNQPNQSSTAINRVLDSNASQIMGRLNANGQVFLLNPNGVVFSKTAQVNVGGIVASTLNLNDADIYQNQQNGKYTLKGDANSNASVENHGSIQTLKGGTVALIAPNVKNTGTIKTPDGITHLTSASQVTLALQNGSLTQYQVDQGVLQGLVENGGAIIADNGAVYLTAKAKDSLSKAVVNHTGVIEANRLTQNAKGEIILLGDMQVGTTTVSGILKAEGKNGVDGGFIETSAANVQIQNGTKVSTLSDGGKTGKWLIDPTDFTISSGTADQTNSGIGAETLQSNLAGTDIELQTVSEGEESGDIHVNAEVSWDAPTTLTLTAHNDININNNITAQNGGLTLNAANSITATGNVDVGTFTLNNGNWLQNAPLLPSFKATDFQLHGGGFIRALGGDGTASNPYQLTDIYGVQGVGTKLNDNFELANDIDASGTVNWNGTSGFKPIGGFGDNGFTGIFEGNHKTISGLNIKAEQQEYVGLFGAILGTEDLKAEINNLNLTNIAISGNGFFVGGLVGINDGGSISNSTVSGTISGSGFLVGGLVGGNTGLISNSTVSGTILGNGSVVGGLVGSNYLGSISDSTVSGTISGSGYAVGGLVGSNYLGSISDSTANTKIDLTFENNYSEHRVGGLVGYSIDGQIISSHATGDINIVNNATQTTLNVGGLVGMFEARRSDEPNVDSENPVLGISDSTASGAITVTSETNNSIDGNYSNLNFNIGGLIGSNHAGAISGSTASGNVSLTSTINSNFSVNGGNYNYNYIEVDSYNNIGGLIGLNDGGAISGSTASGDVSLISTINSNVSVNAGNYHDSDIDVGSDNNLGGLIGSNYAGAISGSTASGNVSLVSTIDSTVTVNGENGNYSIIEVESDNNLGGLIGSNDGGAISDSTASGSITVMSNGTDFEGNIGGLIGSNYAGAISESTASGHIQLNVNSQTTDLYLDVEANLGGLVGYNRWADIQNSHATGNVDANITLDSKILTERYTDPNIELKVGGLVGSNDYGDISNSDALGHITAKAISKESNAGYVGVRYPYVEAEIYAGGLVGENSGNITQSYALGDVKTSLTAEIIKKTVDEAFNPDSHVYARSYTGGLVGENSGNIKESYAFGDVSASVKSSVIDGATGTDISSSFEGEVLAQAYAGGLVGVNIGNNYSNDTRNMDVPVGTGGNILDSYAVGSVTVTSSGEAFAGGLVGSNGLGFGGDSSIGGDIQNTYATGLVTATGASAEQTYAGGLLGANQIVVNYSYNNENPDSPLLEPLSGTVSNSFWNTETSGQTQGIGGFIAPNQEQFGDLSAEVLAQIDALKQVPESLKGITTAQMKQSSTFKEAGWDISNKGGEETIWRVYEGYTGPLLRNFLIKADTSNSSNKIFYDGKTHSLTLNGAKDLDSSKLLVGSGSGSARNAGTYKAQFYSHQQGYDLLGDTANLTIDAAKLYITTDDITKTYDRTTTANGEAIATNDTQVFEGDRLVGGNFTFQDKNAGTGKVVTVAGVTVEDGNGGKNYIVEYVNNSNSTILKAKIDHVTGITANDRTYDTTTNASLNTGSATFNGLLNGDSLTVGSAQGQFADKNAGIGKTVNINGITLSGADAANYELVNNTATAKANISKAKIDHVTGITANDRTYDTTTNASLNTGSVTFNGLLNGDSLTVGSAQGQFADKNAGAGKTVNLNGITLSGADAANYELVNNTATAKANISKAKIDNITGITANDRVYDGTTNVSLNTGSATFNGLLNGDSLTVGSAQGQFADKNAGTGKTVTINGITLSGDDAANYELVDSTATTTATIKPMVNPVIFQPSAAYLQAIQALERDKDQFEPQGEIKIEVIDGGVNLVGLNKISGEH